jgi:hypothetical protein
LVLGATLGVATHVRPLSYYLIFVMPVLFILFDRFAARSAVLRNDDLKGVTASLIGFGVIFPWLAHVNSAGEGNGLTDHSLKIAWVIPPKISGVHG